MLAQNFKSAAELGIEGRLHATLAKVLVFLETEAIARDEFNMSLWPTFGEDPGCWSGGCIGAWAEKIGGFEIASDAMGDDESDLYLLFFPGDRNGERSPYKATPAEGARALRNYLTTGKASWPEVMGAARA
jgi:hypothetical protein